ncbi:hypothetical protein FQN54_003528 [Arachnomyces sp. PD_36]|nr:hypothetical protein FQN54_003528 [Arachnomyces sp. PD_36]
MPSNVLRRALSLPLRPFRTPSKRLVSNATPLYQATPRTLANTNTRRLSLGRPSLGHRDQPSEKVALQQGRDEHLENADCDSLTPKQLESLFRGEFPTDKPEDFIQIKGSNIHEYRRIRSAFKKSNAQKNVGEKVSVSFNSRFSTTAILRGSPVAIQQQTTTDFYKFMNPRRDDQDIYHPVAREEIHKLIGEHTGIKGKYPDFQLLHSPDGIYGGPLSVLLGEVGFSQSYESLVETATTYLETLSNVRMAILIKYDEKPNYRNPVNSEAAQAQLRESLLQLEVENPPRLTPEHPDDLHGPLYINGLRWVGRLRGMFEIWTRDEKGKAVQKGDTIVSIPPTIGSDPSINSFTLHQYFMGYGQNPANLSIPYSDFLPSPTDTHKAIEINWEELRQSVGFARSRLALTRYRKHLEKSGK